MVERATAGTTIRIEFQKYGRSPVASTPTCASDQALIQGSIVQTCGRFIMPPPVISESGFTELMTIT